MVAIPVLTGSCAAGRQAEFRADAARRSSRWLAAGSEPTDIEGSGFSGPELPQRTSPAGPGCPRSACSEPSRRPPGCGCVVGELLSPAPPPGWRRSGGSRAHYCRATRLNLDQKCAENTRRHGGKRIKDDRLAGARGINAVAGLRKRHPARTCCANTPGRREQTCHVLRIPGCVGVGPPATEAVHLAAVQVVSPAASKRQ